MITRFLVILNLIAYAWEVRVGGPGLLGPFGGANLDAVAQAGALWPNAVLHDGQWWRIVTAAFLHGGLIHLFVNMISLYSLGRFVEMLMGPWRMLIVYVLSLVVSGLGVIYFSPADVPTLGASGAIFGLFGALFASGFKLGRPGMQLVRDNFGILLLNLAMTFTIPEISKAAHVAGLIGGFVVTFLIFYPPRPVQPVVLDAQTGDAYETEYEPPADRIHPHQ